MLTFVLMSAFVLLGWVTNALAACRGRHNPVELQVLPPPSVPKYITHHGGHTVCEWRITAERDFFLPMVITLHAVRVKMLSTRDCSSEKITVFDGYNASAKVIGKFCSMSQWKFSSSGRYLYIRFESDTQSSMAYFILYYKAELRTHPRTTTRRARTTTSTEPPSSKADGGLSFHSFPTWVLYFVVAVALFIFFYFAIKICVGKSKCGTSATGVPVNDNSAAAARDGDSDGAHPGSPETAALTAEPSTAADSPPSYFSLQHDCASPAPSAPQPHGASARPSEPPPSPGAPPDYASLFPAHGTSDYYYKSEVLGEDCSW